MGRNEEHFTEIFKRVLQGIRLLTPTDHNRPNNNIASIIVYQAISGYRIQCFWWAFIL